MRIGQGFDAHRFTEGDHVMLGGVRIPHEHGLAAHSDGDVLIHAICDALLGAAALGDIGRHFPDSSDEFAGIDSRVLLRRTAALLAGEGLRLVNLDATLICERPRLAPHVPEMRQVLALDLEVAEAQISLKATTTERMGFTGRGEGIAALAVCLLEPF